MDLFEYAASQQKEQESPLASRLRPRTLDEVVGQQHIIGEGRLLYRAIKADKLSSIIRDVESRYSLDVQELSDDELGMLSAAGNTDVIREKKKDDR